MDIGTLGSGCIWHLGSEVRVGGGIYYGVYGHGVMQILYNLYLLVSCALMCYSCCPKNAHSLDIALCQRGATSTVKEAFLLSSLTELTYSSRRVSKLAHCHTPEGDPRGRTAMPDTSLGIIETSPSSSRQLSHIHFPEPAGVAVDMWPGVALRTGGTGTDAASGQGGRRVGCP